MIYDLVFRQLGRHKTRTALTVLGVAIGILLVTSLSSFSEGISGTVNTELALISGKITVLAEGNSFGSYVESELDESLVTDISNMGGIERAAGIVTGAVPGVGTVFGLHMDDIDLFNLDVGFKEGRIVDEGAYEVALGYKYADSSGKKVGDIILIRSKRYDVVGILEPIGSMEIDGGMVTSYEPAQEIFKKRDKVSLIIAKPLNADESETIAREIEALQSGITALSDKDSAREAAKFTSQIGVMTFALGSIAAIIAGIGIMNVMFMSVRERRREIGTMKALGATTNEILMQVILEAIIITLVGEAMGLTLSLGAVSALNSMSSQVSATITPSLLITVTIFALALGIGSGVLPAREAARTQPAVVLRYE